MAVVYWTCWFIPLLIFILAYCIASCKYKALTDGFSIFPSIELSKKNPKLREKVPIKIYHIIIGFISLWIPIVNIFTSLLFFSHAYPDEEYYEFLIPEENPIMKIIFEVGNFLNRDIS